MQAYSIIVCIAAISDKSAWQYFYGEMKIISWKTQKIMEDPSHWIWRTKLSLKRKAWMQTYNDKNKDHWFFAHSFDTLCSEGKRRQADKNVHAK